MSPPAVGLDFIHSNAHASNWATNCCFLPLPHNRRPKCPMVRRFPTVSGPNREASSCTLLTLSGPLNDLSPTGQRISQLEGQTPIGPTGKHIHNYRVAPTAPNRAKRGQSNSISPTKFNSIQFNSLQFNLIIPPHSSGPLPFSCRLFWGLFSSHSIHSARPNLAPQQFRPIRPSLLEECWPRIMRNLQAAGGANYKPDFID